MGQDCSCDVLELTKPDFGEGSSESDHDGSDTDTASDTASETQSISHSLSDTNVATEGKCYTSDNITDVSNLSNDDNITDVGDTDGYATDLAIIGSSISAIDSTVLSSTSSSSSGMTPIPAPSPLEIIRSVAMKQHRISKQMQKRRHSLPSIITGSSNSNHRNSIHHSPRNSMEDMSRSRSVRNQYEIEDLYNQNNSGFDPEPLYDQFRRYQQHFHINEEFNNQILPHNNPTISMNNSTNSNNSIEEDLSNIPTINNTFNFAENDNILTDDYTDNTSASDISSDDEYYDDDDDTSNNKELRPWNKYKKHNMRILIDNDDEKIEEKKQINKQKNVAIKNISLKEPTSPTSPLAAVVVHNDKVPILSPTKTSNGDNASFDNIMFENGDNDDIDDEILPLTSITPTNSFDNTPKNKIINTKLSYQKQVHFSNQLTNELLSLAERELVPSDKSTGTDTNVLSSQSLIAPSTANEPNEPNDPNTPKVTENASNQSNKSTKSNTSNQSVSSNNSNYLSLSPNANSLSSLTTSHSNSSQCSNLSLSVMSLRSNSAGITEMNMNNNSNSKSNSNSNELI